MFQKKIKNKKKFLLEFCGLGLHTIRIQDTALYNNFLIHF